MKNIGIYQSQWELRGEEQRFAGMIAQILSEKNQVTILHRNPDFNGPACAAAMGLDWSRVAFRSLEFDNGYNPSELPNHPMKRMWAEANACRAWSEEYDVFLECCCTPPVFNRSKHGILLVTFPRVTFEEANGHDTPAWRKKNFFRKFREKCGQRVAWRCRFASYDAFWCESNFSKRWGMNRWGIVGRTLNPPLDSELRSLDKESLIVGNAPFTSTNFGRQDVLIAAFQDIFDRLRALPRRDLPEWKLRLFGECAETPEDQAFVERLRLKAEGYPVEIVVNPEREVVRESLGRATFFWHATGYGSNEYKNPERTDALGVVLQEAQAAGAIPCAFHAGGVAESIQHGKTGFLWSSYAELLKTTVELLADPARRAVLQNAVVQCAKRYAEPEFRENLRKLLQGTAEV